MTQTPPDPNQQQPDQPQQPQQPVQPVSPYAPQQPQELQAQQPPQPPQGPVGDDDAWMTEPGQPRKRGLAMWLVPAVVVAGVLGLGGGGYFVYTALAGGGDQPSTVIPGNAIGYLRIDADPSLGQKIAAVRFLNKVPQIKDAGLGSGDWRKKMVDQLRKSDDAGTLKGIDYDKDIAPWLGDKVAVAALPPASGKEPTVVFALQVKDEAQAKSGIEKLSKDATASDITFRDGYALITEKGKAAEVTTALDKGSLATNTDFTADMEALGEQGVLSGWADLKSVAKFGNGNSTAAVQDQLDKLGRVAFALRFGTDHIELAGVGRGALTLKSLSGSGASRIGTLPADTVAALSISGADQIVDQAWKAFNDNSAALGAQGDDIKAQIKGLEQQLGITIPDDLKTLLGKRLVISAPEQDFSGETIPSVGLVVTTDAQKAEQTIAKLERAMSDQGQELPLKHRADGTTFYAATTQSYLDELSKGGKLGESETFKLALPNAADETFAAYVDLDKLEKLYAADVPADQRDLITGLRAIGLSVSVKDDGNSRFSLRIVGN